jgi:hypothetical protein
MTFFFLIRYLPVLFYFWFALTLQKVPDASLKMPQIKDEMFSELFNMSDLCSSEFFLKS